MKAKLIKVKDYYYLQELSAEHIVGSQCERTLGDTDGNGEYGKLSKQNCDAIFGVTDVEKLAKMHHKLQYIEAYNPDIEPYVIADYKAGFNKAMSLNKDNVFTLDDVMLAWQAGAMSRSIIDANWLGYIRDIKLKEHKESYKENVKPVSLQQPTEIEVEIEMEWITTKTFCDTCNKVMYPDYRCEDKTCFNWQPKLDSEGCLILKRVTGAAN
jgi:hypothetical protein